MQLGAFAVIGFIGDMYLLANHDQHIAYGAHLGGFLSGVVIAAIVTTDLSDARRITSDRGTQSDMRSEIA